jgi:hypothetical protein
LEGAIRGVENPYGNFVYEPLGNSVSGLGDQLNYLINEYEKDPYWKEAFRILKEKGTCRYFCNERSILFCFTFK